MKRNKSPLWNPLVVFLAVGCGGAPPAQDAADVEAKSTQADAPAEAEPRTVAWADMDRNQRMEFMGLTVLPEMKKLFEEYDAKGFAEFKCQTCHGNDMKEVDYRMPNGLFALAKPDPIPGSMEYDAPMTKFMQEKVMPEMATMLGMEPGTQFGCFNCHEAE
jgi:hypothetical protein